MLPITQEAARVLTREEQWKLHHFKQRYDLVSEGFTPEEARRLCFFKWMYTVARMGEGVPYP